MGLDCLSNQSGWIIDQLNKVFQREWDHSRVMAAVKQRQLAADLGQDRKSVEGLGQPVMEVDSTVYHAWGQKLGYACWRDKGFRKMMQRDNPELRVKATGTKLQVGYNGSSKRFSKKY